MSVSLSVFDFCPFSNEGLVSKILCGNNIYVQVQIPLSKLAQCMKVHGISRTTRYVKLAGPGSPVQKGSDFTFQGQNPSRKFENESGYGYVTYHFFNK